MSDVVCALQEISDLIDRCLQPNAVARPTAEEIFHWIQAAPRRGWPVDVDGNQTGPSTPGNEDVPALGARLRSGRDITLPGNSSVVVATHVVGHAKGGSAGSMGSGPSRISVRSGIEEVSGDSGSGSSTTVDSSDDGTREGVSKHVLPAYPADAVGGTSDGVRDAAKAIRPVKTSVADKLAPYAGFRGRHSAADASAASMATAADLSGSMQSSRGHGEPSRSQRLRSESVPHAPASPTTTVSTAHSSLETASSLDAQHKSCGRISKRFNGITDELLQKMLFREPVAPPARPSAMVLAALVDAHRVDAPSSGWPPPQLRLNPFDADPVSSSPAPALLAAEPSSSKCSVNPGGSGTKMSRRSKEPISVTTGRPARVLALDIPAAEQLATNGVTSQFTLLPLVPGTAARQPTRSLRRNSL